MVHAQIKGEFTVLFIVETAVNLADGSRGGQH